ncbi:uncharacterized protein VICG_00336 [Vittaforma corneae ATCC 50505]|uniref:Signal peptidase complex subunit 2 n=1 Tax=Vittaforma corneae (strain ATCC 50505) TaxID=993615 RepID=L2GPS5_VITCO|nr:uncharacterized protein VICG_00336 [Vittaforma corneae ATCC 50505]ELA42584.1 hypothetical protein VICG_00336 [Vittaforma corneae ATCC 50505]
METKNTKSKDNVVDKITKKYIKTPITADIYTLEQIKITLDDFLVEYCRERGFQEKYHLTDFQNVIGIISTIQASIVVVLSLFCKFEDVRRMLFMCIISYFAVNIFCYIVSYFFGGKLSFYEFSVITRIDRMPVYVVLLYWKDRMVPVKYYKNVSELFDETGVLDHIEFLKDLEELFKE